MALRDVRAAVIIVALASLTWAVPAVMFATAPRNYPTVDTHTVSVDIFDATIDFAAPQGWQRMPVQSLDTAVFAAPGGGRRLLVRADGDVRDLRRYQDRAVARLQREGAAVLLGDALGGEFSGRRCTVIVAERQAHGDCAIVGRDDIAITILSTTTDAGGEAAPVQDVVDSLVVHPKELL